MRAVRFTSAVRSTVESGLVNEVIVGGCGVLWAAGLALTPAATRPTASRRTISFFIGFPFVTAFVIIVQRNNRLWRTPTRRLHDVSQTLACRLAYRAGFQTSFLRHYNGKY